MGILVDIIWSGMKLAWKKFRLAAVLLVLLFIEAVMIMDDESFRESSSINRPDLEIQGCRIEPAEDEEDKYEVYVQIRNYGNETKSSVPNVDFRVGEGGEYLQSYLDEWQYEYGYNECIPPGRTVEIKYYLYDYAGIVKAGETAVLSVSEYGMQEPKEYEYVM